MDSTWMLQAKCARERMDPRLFDADDPTPAMILCGGCPVQSACAEWHLQPINISGYVERLGGSCPDDVDDIVYVSGVKAAGMVIE